MADRAHCRGFALVESLVALLLVATALLGVAGLQLASLRGGAHALELLEAHGHVAAWGESFRALHGLPAADRHALPGAGAPGSCRGERRCTPREFAADEAARRSAAAAARGWIALPTASTADADPPRATLELRRNGRVLARLGVES